MSNHKNHISKYTHTLLKNEKARFCLSLQNDIQSLLNGAWYIPNFICSSDDMTFFETIIKELDGYEIVNWSKHFKYENFTKSKTAISLIEKLSDLFKVEILVTRINYYVDGSSWKPFHHDSHAFSDDKRENFTMGISLGSSRNLAFRHVKTGEIFNFPQNNGDIFAFDSIVNRKFMHGVPKNKTSEKRISIIAWGRKTTENNILNTLKTIPKTNKLLDKMKNKNIVQNGWNN